MTTGKLGTGLGTDSPQKTIELKHTDYSINKFQSDFSKGRKTIRTKILNSGIKGLLLSQSITTKKKYFVQQIWFDGKADHWTVGEFRPGIFGVKECQTKVVAIMKTHTNDNGLWIKSPKITEKHNKDRVCKAEKDNRQMLTVKECIERLCKAGFPKIKREGLLTGDSIRDICLHLIGYNKRTKHLEYDDDNFGNGIVTFRACKVYNTNKPQSWNDLFSKFSSGHGCIKKVNGKALTGVSMYDHPIFSKYLIEELTPGLINSYIDEHSPSWGTKRKMIYALQVLWENSKKYMGPSRPLNPTTKEALEVKLPGISKAKNSKYNKIKNGPDEMQKMWLSFQKQSTKHPFQAELIMLMMTAGRHFKETSKIKKADVYPKGKKDNDFGIDNIIVLPAGSIKGREEGYIPITEPVQFVLDQIDNIYKRPKLTKYKWVPWLFPSFRSSPKSWLEDGKINQEYISSKKTRVKDIRECWKSMLADTGLKLVVPRLFRKTYSSGTVTILGTSAKGRKLTGHKKASTLDLHYDIHDTDQIKDYADQVANSFKWVVKDKT